MSAKAHFDGGARGTPGPASAAAIIWEDGGEKHTETIFLESATSNEAEYAGILLVAKKMVELGIDGIDIYSDSKLIVNQVLGNWKTREPRLRKLRDEVRELLGDSDFSLSYVPRDQNDECDALCRQVMDANAIDNAVATVSPPFQNS